MTLEIINRWHNEENLNEFSCMEMTKVEKWTL